MRSSLNRSKSVILADTAATLVFVVMVVVYRRDLAREGDDALSALVAEGRAEDGTEPVGEAHAIRHGGNRHGECLDGAGSFLNCHESILAEISENCKLYFTFFSNPQRFFGGPDLPSRCLPAGGLPQGHAGR